MITNEERCEVAAKLRELGNDITEDRFFHWDDAVCESWHAIVKTVGVDNGNPYDDHRETCSRLAELIEPLEERTCRVVRKTVDIDGELMIDYTCCFNQSGWNNNFCPNCGAKVVKSD